METVENNKTDIVIDDDSGITELFSEMLQLQGINILGVGNNGIDAIQLFKEFSPDLVFMDINMPKLNGIDALIEIKKTSIQSKVIIVTSDTSTELKEKLEKIVASGIVYKPFDMNKIMQVTKILKDYVKCWSNKQYTLETRKNIKL